MEPYPCKILPSSIEASRLFSVYLASSIANLRYLAKNIFFSWLVDIPIEIAKD